MAQLLEGALAYRLATMALVQIYPRLIVIMSAAQSWMSSSFISAAVKEAAVRMTAATGEMCARTLDR